MSVRFRNGRYIIDYYPSGYKGKRVVFTTQKGTTEADAHAIEKELRSRRNKNKQTIIDPASTINRLIKSYLIHCELHQSPGTVRDKRSHFDKHIIPYFGSLHINEITNAHITAYKQDMKKKTYVIRKKTEEQQEKTAPVKNRTITKGLNYFSAFFKWAYDELNISTPIPLRFRKLPSARPVPIVLSLHEAMAFINAADRRCKNAGKCEGNPKCINHVAYNVLFKIYFYLGLRNRAGRRLRWDDIDWTSHAIKTIEKGDKTKWHPLPDDLHEELRTLYIASSSEWAFPSPTDKQKPINNIKKAVLRAKKKAGIVKRVYPHLLRHSIATHLLDSNVDIRQIQSFLDHAQISTTEFYTRVSMEKKRQALEKAGIKTTKQTT